MQLRLCEEFCSTGVLLHICLIKQDVMINAACWLSVLNLWLLLAGGQTSTSTFKFDWQDSQCRGQERRSLQYLQSLECCGNLLAAVRILSVLIVAQLPFDRMVAFVVADHVLR
jgi:hypothetical protein